MTQRERELLGRVHEVISEIGRLNPQNPADIKAITHNLPVATKTAKLTAQALSHIGYGDLADAGYTLELAEREIARRPEQGAERG